MQSYHICYHMCYLYVWLLLLSITFWNSFMLHYVSVAFLFYWYSLVWIHRILSIPFTIDRHLHSFHFFLHYFKMLMWTFNVQIYIVVMYDPQISVGYSPNGLFFYHFSKLPYLGCSLLHTVFIPESRLTE